MARNGNGRSQEPPSDENRKGRTPDYIVGERVRRVWFWMLAGFKTAAIYRLAAKAHALEWKAREAAKKARKDVDEYPPLVWAVDPTPVSDRTIDTYIARAKEMYETDGRSLPKEVAAQFGVIMARLNDLYARAYKAAMGDPPNVAAMNTCERLIRLHSELFGIGGSIKPNWMDDPGAAKVSDVPELPTTEEAAERELREMMSKVLLRMENGTGAAKGKKQN